MTRPCSGCGRDFTTETKQRRYCTPCQTKNDTKAKRKYEFKQKGITFAEMSAAEEAAVDARFASALAEIRKSGVHRVEAASWNYAGRYREP